jgi:peptide deformylase
MAIRKVAQLGHPVLRKIAAVVTPEQISTPAFQQLCDDLLETMDGYEGLGLAAPQVHESLRVVVFKLDEEEPMFLVNPVITVLEDSRSSSYEGCLSVTGIRGLVSRPDVIRVEALDRKGEKFAFRAEGWAARVVQHECDHLDGVVYVDKADPKSLAFLPEYRRFGPLVPADDDTTDEEGGE